MKMLDGRISYRRHPERGAMFTVNVARQALHDTEASGD